MWNSPLFRGCSRRSHNDHGPMWSARDQLQTLAARRTHSFSLISSKRLYCIYTGVIVDYIAEADYRLGRYRDDSTGYPFEGGANKEEDDGTNQMTSKEPPSNKTKINKLGH
jgi:hypothetical protein